MNMVLMAMWSEMVMEEVFEDDAMKDIFSLKPEGWPDSMTCLLTSNFQHQLGAKVPSKQR
jgi:hypothetical protein